MCVCVCVCARVCMVCSLPRLRKMDFVGMDGDGRGRGSKVQVPSFCTRWSVSRWREGQMPRGEAAQSQPQALLLPLIS